MSESKMKWKELYRVGYLGRRRDTMIRYWNEKYGKENWKLGHIFDGKILDFVGVCKIYENAYFKFLSDNPLMINFLKTYASDVYDNALTNVNSGLDYTIQESYSNHIQDIAVRNVFNRLGHKFEGDRLIQIRTTSKDKIGKELSPGNVPFHIPNLILEPQLTGWWRLYSVESFYQSNKYLYKRVIK